MTDRPVMLIAGGSGSVGAAVAREALTQGWAVVVHGRDAGRLFAMVAELRQHGPAEPVVANMDADGAAQALVDQAQAAFGRLDAVIDCTANGAAGITGLFEATDPASYTPNFDRSAGWFQRLAHAAYPHLKESGGTLIAFVADAGRFAAPRQAVLGAARAATIGFVRNLAVEAARDGVRVHALSPGFIAGSASAQRMGSERMARAQQRAGLGLPTPQDIAPLAVFLCGPGAAKITGQIISINGGLNA